MKDQLLEHHEKELVRCREGLLGWEIVEAPYGDQKAKANHIATFKELVDFHRRAVKWLEAQ